AHDDCRERIERLQRGDDRMLPPEVVEVDQRPGGEGDQRGKEGGGEGDVERADGDLDHLWIEGDDEVDGLDEPLNDRAPVHHANSPTFLITSSTSPGSSG